MLAVSRVTGEYELVGIFHAGYSQGSALNVVIAIDQVRDLMTTLKRSAPEHQPELRGLERSAREDPPRPRSAEGALLPVRRPRGEHPGETRMDRSSSRCSRRTSPSLLTRCSSSRVMRPALLRGSAFQPGSRSARRAGSKITRGQRCSPTCRPRWLVLSTIWQAPRSLMPRSGRLARAESAVETIGRPHHSSGQSLRARHGVSNRHRTVDPGDRREAGADARNQHCSLRRALRDARGFRSKRWPTVAPVGRPPRPVPAALTCRRWIAPC